MKAFCKFCVASVVPSERIPELEEGRYEACLVFIGFVRREQEELVIAPFKVSNHYYVDVIVLDIL